MNREKEQLDIALELIVRTVPLLDKLTEQAKESAISSRDFSTTYYFKELALIQDMLMFLAGAGYPGRYLKRRTEECLNRLSGESDKKEGIRKTLEYRHNENETVENRTTNKVVCIDNTNYPVSLTRGRIYQVVECDNLEGDEICAISNSGQAYIYDKSAFLPLGDEIAGDYRPEKSKEIGTFECEKVDEIAPNNKASDRVVCVNNSGYPASLTVGKIYNVISGVELEEDEIYIDNDGEGYIFARSKFRPLNDESDEWHGWKGTSEPE